MNKRQALLEAATNGQPPATQTAKPLRTVMDDKKESILRVVPDVIGRERFWSIATSVALSADLSDCEPASILQAVYGCAKLGLVPDKALGHVYIIPRKSKDVVRAEVQVGYRGYFELARRSRLVGAPQAEVVYSNDHCQLHYGTNRRIEHQPWYMVGASEPGEPVLAYCTWHDLQSGTVEFRVATRERIQRAKQASQSAHSEYSPWNTDGDSMAKKTAVIEGSKVWPLTPELAQAVQWDEESERGARQSFDASKAIGSQPSPTEANEAPADNGNGQADAPAETEQAEQAPNDEAPKDDKPFDPDEAHKWCMDTMTKRGIPEAKAKVLLAGRVEMLREQRGGEELDQECWRTIAEEINGEKFDEHIQQTQEAA